jgi:phosphate transport system permease protein
MQKARTSSRIRDRIFYTATALCASSPILFLGVIAVIVFIQSIPAIRFMGAHYLTSAVWNMGNLYGAMEHHHGVSAPAGASYGGLTFIVGTVASSVIALMIGVPISIFTALILAYKVRGAVRSILSILVELLAGIPSVIFGLWGIIVLAPWVRDGLAPILTGIGHFIPFLRGPIGTGEGLLTSGLVLAFMIVPIMTAAIRDLLQQVPVLYREGGIGLGMTSWEVVRLICLPYIKEGMVGAIALGWGRAMGETMAVLMVSGSAVNTLPHNLYSPISTMAAFIADQLDSAFTDASHMAIHALAELALILMIITLVTNILARLLVSGRSGIGARKVGASRS